MMLWCDLETTGLDPKKNVILEVALLLTDNDLNHMASFWAVTSTIEAEGLPHIDPVVEKMHNDSGLWFACSGSTLTMFDVQVKAMSWMEQNQAKGLPMAGSSLGLDRAFLAEWMPKLNDQFHYRNIDVSTLKELARVWKPEVVKERNPHAAHRGLMDLQDSIEELKHYRKHLINA